MLDRPKIIKSLMQAIETLKSSDFLTERDEEEIDCINLLIERIKSKETDQNIDDLAFFNGLDQHLFWEK